MSIHFALWVIVDPHYQGEPVLADDNRSDCVL